MSHPSITAIIPNYNHEAFLAQRIESVLFQTIKDISILILDDASTDGSMEVASSYARQYPGRIQIIRNEVNTNSVFTQWSKGISRTDSDIIWICESDDYCELDFAERLVSAFRDPAVELAFGDITMVDEDGRELDSENAYVDAVLPGYFGTPLSAPATWWFANGFSMRNIIKNASGAMFRNNARTRTAVAEVTGFRVCGDWVFYSLVAGIGRINYVPGAVSYFRRHANATSIDYSKAVEDIRQLYDGYIKICLKRDIPFDCRMAFLDRCHEVFSERSTGLWEDKRLIQLQGRILAQGRDITNVAVLFPPQDGLAWRRSLDMVRALATQEHFVCALLPSDSTQIATKIKQSSGGLPVYHLGPIPGITRWPSAKLPDLDRIYVDEETARGPLGTLVRAVGEPELKLFGPAGLET